VIRVAITQAAFDAIAATLPLGSVAYEPAVEEGGLRYIWLEARWLDRLKSYRGPGRVLATSSCGWRGRAEGPVQRAT
jgi:hypothetical protein